MGMSELNILMAEREIRRRLVDYYQGIDRCDAALTASAYHLDSHDEHGSFVGTGQEVAAYAAESLAKRYEATQHTTADPAIDFVSDTEAHVVTYVHAEHVGRDDEGPFLITFEGEYRDRFEHRDGTWRIASREVIHCWDSRQPLRVAFDPDRFTQRSRTAGPSPD